MRSIRRAFSALEFLVAAAPDPVRVVDVARHLEVSSATASRVLAAFVEHGYGGRTADRRFTVGPRSIPLATKWMARLRAAADGPAARVAQGTGEVVMVNQLLGSEQVPVLRHEPRGPATDQRRVLAGVTTPYPVWATASGRALLSSLSPGQRSRLLPAEPYPSSTERAVTSWTQLHHAIRTGAKDGLHLDHGELHHDLHCFAVALEPAADAVLAIAVICAGEPSAPQRARIHRLLRSEAYNVGLGLTNSP